MRWFFSYVINNIISIAIPRWHKAGIKDEYFNLYRAFDIDCSKFVTYKQLLLGLAAMEPTTQHGGAPAEQRCRYIFRYYDQDQDGYLQFEEFK